MNGGWKGIRNYFGVCNMRAMALRGENIRKLELPDLFLYEMTSEGSNCNAIVSVLNEGKTNQFGKVEVGGSLRGKDVLFFPHSSMAMWLYQYLHLQDFPDLSKSEEWYDMKIFPPEFESCTTEMRRDTHSNAIRRMFKYCGINATKATHFFRGLATRTAQQAGVPDSGLRSLGRWQGGSMEHPYAPDLPESAMRALAGFSAEYRNCYIKRAEVEVPIELLHQAFPSVDSEMEIEKGKSTPNMAKLQFLEPLKYS